jgi:hypothetical protein
MPHLQTPPSFLQHHAASRTAAAAKAKAGGKARGRNDGEGEDHSEFGMGPTDGNPAEPAGEEIPSYGTAQQRMPADGWYLNQNWQTPGEQSLESLDAQAKEELEQWAAGGAQGAGGDEGADESLMQFGARDMSSLPPPMFPTSFNTRAKGAAGSQALRHTNPVPAFAMRSAAQSGVAGPFAPDAAGAAAAHAPTVVAPGAVTAKLQQQQQQQQAAAPRPTAFIQTAPAVFEPPAAASFAELSHAFPAAYPAAMHAQDASAGANPVLTEQGARRTLQQRVAAQARGRAAQGARKTLSREEALRGRPAPSDAVRARKPL